MKTKETNNWVSNETPSYYKKMADRTLSKVKKERKGKRFKMVKISNHPPTWKEVEIKD